MEITILVAAVSGNYSNLYGTAYYYIYKFVYE